MSLLCAECLCEWCASSFLYLIVGDHIHLLDLATPSWVADAQVYASQLGLRFLAVERVAIEPECIELIPYWLARQEDLLAVEATRSQVTVASPSPTRLDFFESLRFSIGRSVVPCLASRDAIHRALCLLRYENQDIRRDVLEDDPSARPLIHRAFREAKQETDRYWLSLGDASSRDYEPYLCHLYSRQKRLLDKEFGIAWSSPIELNPNISVGRRQ